MVLGANRVGPKLFGADRVGLQLFVAVSSEAKTNMTEKLSV